MKISFVGGFWSRKQRFDPSGRFHRRRRCLSRRLGRHGPPDEEQSHCEQIDQSFAQLFIIHVIEFYFHQKVTTFLLQ